MATATRLGAAAPTVDPDALRRSFDMLQLQMKLRVLQVHYERGRFYYPPEWPKRIQDEYESLAAQVEEASRQHLAGMDDWLEQVNKTRENEALAMLKLVEEYLPKLIEHDREKASEVEAWLQENSAAHGKRKNSLEVARFVEGISERIYAANKDKENAGIQADLIRQWRENAARIYRGAIADKDNLVASIAAYERKRIDVETRLAFLKQVEEGLQIAKDAQAPLEKLQSVIEEEAVNRAQQFLQDRYLDVATNLVADAWGKLKEEVGALHGIYSEVASYDSNVALKGNPTAMAAAKRFALLGGLYKYTLGKVEDFPGVKPFAKMLAYYGDVIAAIPQIAVWAQTLVTQVDQDYRNVRALDAWQVTEKPPGDLRQLTDFDAFELQIATDANFADHRFYLLVPKEVVPRGYATLDLEQFQRLTQAIADERFLNAPDESSRGVSDWITENMFEWRSTDVGSAVVSDAFLEELRKAVRKRVFTEQQAMELALGKGPIEFKGEQWTAGKFRQKAEDRLDRLAHQMILRQALYRFDKRESARKWTEFHSLLLEQGLAFSPRQLLELFAFYHGSEDNTARFRSYLDRLAQDAARDKIGSAEIGVPVIASDARDPKATGGSVKLSAHAVVSDLAPRREVEAIVEWNLPSAVKLPPTRVTLGNGAKEFTQEVKLPPNVAAGDLKAKFIVRIEEPAEARLPTPPAPSEFIRGGGEMEAAARPAAEKITREFTGRTIDAPLRFSPKAPKAELSYGLGAFSTNAFLGVRVTPPAIAGVSAWEIRRARRPEGPWTILALDHHTSDKSYTDREVTRFRGNHVWYYVALPKAQDQMGRPLREPDFSDWAAVPVELSMETPRLTLESLTSDELRLRSGRESDLQYVQKRREDRQRSHEQNLERLRAQYNRPGLDAEQRAWIQRDEESAIRYFNLEEYTDRRSFAISWDKPQGGGALRTVVPQSEVRFQLFRATDAQGPYEPIHTGNAHIGIASGFPDSLPGFKYYFRARFFVPTGDGGILSDWASISGTEAERKWGSVNAELSANRQLATLSIGPGQRVRIQAESAQFSIRPGCSSAKEFEKHYRPHGPEGVDEASILAFSQEQQDQYSKDFWSRQSERRLRDERPKLQQQLQDLLARRATDWYWGFKTNAPWPGGRLGALIGAFYPAAAAPSQGNQKPEPLFFHIGAGAVFTAPAAGQVSVTFNWPVSREWELANEIRLKAAFETFADPQQPLPAFGEPVWTRKTGNDGAGNEWSIFCPIVEWQAQANQAVRLYTASSPEGPWFARTMFNNRPPGYSQDTVHPAQEIWVRLKRTFQSGNPIFFGEAWTSPKALRLEPQTLHVRRTGSATLLGRRGQILQLSVTGNWDPFRYAGIEAYGPEGIPEETYRRIAAEMGEKEKTPGANSQPSNLPNLLGVEMQTPGPSARAQGGVQNCEYWLGRKFAFDAPELPAGALVARFAATPPEETLRGEHTGFARGYLPSFTRCAVPRKWTFTFPADGVLTFSANFGGSWVGRHHFEGGGELQLHCTMTAPSVLDSESGEYPSDWRPPPLPKPEWEPTFSREVNQRAGLISPATDSRTAAAVTPP